VAIVVVAVVELKPTWYPAVPPVHKSILENAAYHKDMVARSRLRFIRSAAARLPPSLMLGLEASFNAPVVEAYGMTEAFAIGANPLPPKMRKPGSVGISVGPEMAIMDRDGNLVEKGRVGEIVVRGPNVMRGYEGSDEENAKSFINGWFRTGDLGHVDSDGYIFIDGRVREVVNRGGEKVTPNEVDDVLGQHPAVSEAATFGVPHEALGEDLASAVVLRDGAEASEGDLQLFVSERLAIYKVPSRFFFVKGLPKGPSGKILRRKLLGVLGLTGAAAEAVPTALDRKIPPTAPAVEGGLIAEWNENATQYPRQLCIHQIFEGVVAKDPARVAIRHNEIELTYGELNAKANQLARRLIAEGAGPGQFVGVCMERSPELVISFLAVLKAGAAYVPLFPPSDSMRRIASYAEVAGIKLALAKKIYEQMLPGGVKKLYFQSTMDESAGLDGGNIRTATSPESPAYVLYVPSTTGKPKGVCVPHRAVNRLALNTNYVSIGADDVVALQSSPDTNLIVWEIWGSLLNGARMEIFDMRDILSPKGFAKKLGGKGVTVLGLTTPFFNLFTVEVPGGFKALKTLIFTGEVADPAAVRRLMEGGPPRRLVNAYGNTETTGFSTWHLIEGTPETGAPLPIGVPVSNAKVHILDDALKPVPVGSEGELCIGGEGVALGYLNQPEATREAFLPDPFNPGGVMYRTGDMARLNPSGWIEFVGRQDRQVKVHGFRVELGEIEQALMEHPAVRACSVAYTNVEGATEKMLVAHVVPSGPSVPTVEELHRFLLPTLLGHMIPSQFVWVDELPLVPGEAGEASGLQAPRVGAGAGADERPREVGDEVERRLTVIWEREMGVRGIRPGDNFFLMGGYSLMAVRIFARMEEEFGIRLSLATLYRRPTLAGIAAELKKAQPKALRSLVPLRASGKRPRLFLVHAADGEVYNYGKLVKALGEDQPAYGFRAIGLHENVPLPRTVEEMASDYVKELKAVQPHGQYHLAGWCAGGVAAMEMAQQLRKAGEEVGLVGILDFEAPETWRWKSRRVARSQLLKEILFLGGDLLRYAKKRRLGRLEIPSRVVGIEKLWMRALGIITTDEESLPGESALLPDTWKAVILNQLKAVHAYKPRRYDGVVTIFKKQLLPTISSPDPTDGWRDYAGGGIVVIPIKGRIHGDMLKPPGAFTTAEKLRERIDWHEGRRTTRAHG